MRFKSIIIAFAALPTVTAFADVKFVNNTENNLTGKIFWIGETMSGTSSEVEIPAKEMEWASGDLWNIKEKIQIIKDGKVVAEVDPRKVKGVAGGGNLRVEIKQGKTPESFTTEVKQTVLGE